MELHLRDKVVLVAGATRGIGRATAECFAAEHARLAVCGRDAAQVERLVDELRTSGVRAWGQAADLASAESTRRFVTSAAGEYGGVDVLVYVPSAFAMGAAPEDWQQMLNTDVAGAIHAFEASKSLLIEAAATRGDASFLVVASVSALEAGASSAYGAMKAAQIHYVKGLARELAPQRVRCNTVSPGNVYAEGGFWDRVKSRAPEVYDRALARNPLSRMANPNEVATAIVFLASPRSAYTTGINLIVDGCASTRVNF